MFKVKHWKTKEEHMVYAAKQNKDMTTSFLFYFDELWHWESADNWIPSV